MAQQNLAVFVCLLALIITSIGTVFGNIDCEDLPIEDCAFSVSSSGARCVLEKYILKVGRAEYKCQTSIIMAEKLVEWIETDDCIKACGLQRMSVGLSTDALLEREFTRKLCSLACQEYCPNIADLYIKLAAGEGVYLPHLCEAQNPKPRRLVMDPISAKLAQPKQDVRSATAPPPTTSKTHPPYRHAASLKATFSPSHEAPAKVTTLIISSGAAPGPEEANAGAPSLPEELAPLPPPFSPSPTEDLAPLPPPFAPSSLPEEEPTPPLPDGYGEAPTPGGYEPEEGAPSPLPEEEPTPPLPDGYGEAPTPGGSEPEAPAPFYGNPYGGSPGEEPALPPGLSFPPEPAFPPGLSFPPINTAPILQPNPTLVAPGLPPALFAG